MIFRNVWDWLGDEKNLKRLSFLWVLLLALLGGLYGLTYWAYERLQTSKSEQEIIINVKGDKANSTEVNLRTALMLRDLGNLRREDGDFEGAEQSFNAALGLIDKADKDQVFHYRVVLYEKVILYREMSEESLYQESLVEYDALFVAD